MAFYKLQSLLTVLAACLLVPLGDVLAVPTPAGGLGREAREILARATPAAPHFAVYSDDWVTGAAPPVADIDGFNVFILSFLLASGAADQAQNWEELSASQRSSIKSEYSAAGIKLIVSAFGSTESPTTSGTDPIDAANTMAAWVKQYDLDGIDVDYEDFDAFDGSSGTAEPWLISFTQQLRTQLPQGDYILTHAPVAPWFEPNTWSGGGYLAINSAVGSLIDWYNVQFYNQGSTEYTDCNGLLNESGGDYPNSAVFQIAANGVELNKIVIGKPGNSGDADSGYIAPSTLATCVEEAKNQGWSAGVMSWEYPDAAASWIRTVRSDSWPV